MSQKNFLFSSESVTEGHPDKISDQISDAILDEIIKQDKTARVACETMVTTGMAVVAGEITTNCYVDIPDVVRQTIQGIGYNDSSMGFDWETCAVLTSIDKQSPDIAMGVNEGEGLHKEQGAGDQGLMFGFACDDTPELMPMPIAYAHRLTRRLAQARKDGTLDFLRPDGKSQVSIRYEDGKPIGVENVVIATQHSPNVTYDALKEGILEEVIQKVIPAEYLTESTKYHINATGRFVIGGPMGDCGLTGRKIIVDTYGGMGRHGGGAFSGKDPSKVDRSACYMMRHIAKNVVAAKLAKRVEVQVAYCIGVAQPVSVMIDSYGTGVVDDTKLAEIVKSQFDLRPLSIIDYLDLRRPIYKRTAAYGHFGRKDEDAFAWERTNRVDDLRKAAGV